MLFPLTRPQRLHGSSRLGVTIALAAVALILVAVLLPVSAAAQPPTVVPRPQETATARPSVGPGTTAPPSATPDAPLLLPPDVYFDDTEVFLPVLRYLGSEALCAPVVALQNMGSEPAQAVALLWDEPERGDSPGASCDRDCGPSRIECTGLIKPGQTWNLLPDQVADGTKSGLVYSFSTKRLSDYGLDVVFGFDDVIAEFMCATLYFAVTGDCDDYRRFSKAWREGAAFMGVPLDIARGAPLAAQVVRTCDDVGAAGSSAVSSYDGGPASRLGAYDPLACGYGNAVPIVHGGAAGSSSYVTVQNAGIECTVAELTLRAHLERDGGTGEETQPCPDVVSCGRVQIGPGNSHTFDVASCVGGNGGAYAGTVTATQPLVTVVDTVADGTLSTYGAAAAGLEWVTDPYDPLAAQVSIGGTVAYGPLVYTGLGPVGGSAPYWASRIHVHNHSGTVDAKVKLYLLDRSGDVIATLVDWVCPSGGVSWDLAEIDKLPGNWIGSVRVESQEWLTPGGPNVQPPAISAVVENVLAVPNGDAAAPAIHEAYSYRMLTEREAYDWQIGQANGGLRSGTGLIAVPTLIKGVDSTAPSSELMITNLVPKPGFTDFAVYIYDQNGLVDFLCAKLNEKQAEYIDLAHWGFVAPGFKGSAAISAQYWEHDVYDSDGQHIANLVGLGAVSAVRAMVPVSSTLVTGLAQGPAASDVASGSVGVPMQSENWQSFDNGLPPCPGSRPPFQPPMATRTPGTPPTAAPSATPVMLPGEPSDAAASEVFVPAVRYSGEGDACAPTIRVQNAGPEPAKVVAALWPDPAESDGDGTRCQGRCGPEWLQCSGLIRPGGAWMFEETGLRDRSKSAAVYSFNTRKLADLGIEPPHQSDADNIADLMCETMFVNITENCTDYVRFKRAYELGTEFEGVPMNLARGAPIAVDVARECEVGGGQPDEKRAASYVGVAIGRIGRTYAGSGDYEYGVPIVHADDNRMGTTLHIQNAGVDCASVEVRYRPQDECGAARSCGTIEVPVGMSRTVDISGCAGEDGDGAGWVASDQPLAIVVDSVVDDALLSQTAAPGVVGTMADASGRQVLVGGQVTWAPLVYNKYMPTTPPAETVWTSRLHVQNLGALDPAKVKLSVLDRAGDVLVAATEWICPREGYTFDLSHLSGLPGNWVGSVRIESLSWHSPGLPPVEPPAISAVAENVRASWPEVGDWTRPLVTEGYSYRLVAEPEAFDWPAGHGAGGLDSGVGLVAIPSLTKGQAASGANTEFTITNVVTKPGFTDFLIIIYDQNGLLDYVCEKLNEGQTEYIDLSHWGVLSRGFQGSALISATFWEHDAFAGDGRYLRNLVGLAAVSAVRPYFVGHETPGGRPEGDEDGPGDASAGILAVPFGLGDGAVPAHFNNVCPSFPAPIPSRTPTPTPTPTGAETPSPTATPRPAPSVAFFPAVVKASDYLATAVPPPPAEPFVPTGYDASPVMVPALARAFGPGDCLPSLSLQNVGNDAAVAAIVLWGDASECLPDASGPMAIECTGLVAPGASWHVDGAEQSSGAKGAVVFSLSTEPAASLGMPSQSQSAAGYLCNRLAAELPGSADAYRSFLQAFEDGTSYFDVPMAAARGAPFAVQVHRSCPHGADSSWFDSTYGGMPAHDLGSVPGSASVGDYDYILPVAYTLDAGYQSVVHVQNAGRECATVEILTKAQDDCLRTSLCRELTLPPGESRQVSLADCTGSNWRGSVRVRADQRLATAVDLISGDTLMSYNGERLAPAAGDNDVPAPSSPVLFGPLTFSEYQGWEVTVHVANLDGDEAAKVKVYLLDRSGDVITTLVDWICPHGAQTFMLPVVHELKGRWVGSVRVESAEWQDPGAGEAGGPIAGVVAMVKYTDPSRVEQVEAVAYNLLSEQQTFDWPAGSGSGGLTSGVGVVAVPSFGRHADQPGGTSDLVITNLVPKRGFTDYVVALHDQNGMVDVVCQRLAEKQVRYLDPGGGYDTAPWTATSAVISATYWEHPVYDADDQFVRNLVGLSAVSVQRGPPNGGAFGEQGGAVRTDPAGATVGLPLGLDAGRRLTSGLPAAPCPYPHDQPGALTDPRDYGDFQEPALSALALVPVLRKQGDDNTCAPWLAIQNVGGDPSKAVFVSWQEPGLCQPQCTGPASVACTGLISPGHTWHMTADQIPDGARSGVLYSFTARSMAEADLGSGLGAPDDLVADVMCETLRVGAMNDCEQYGLFHAAFTTGGEYARIPLERTYGAPLAVVVDRSCHPIAEDDGETSGPVTSSYRAVGGTEISFGNDSDLVVLPAIGSATGPEELVATVYVQNAWIECASAVLSLGIEPQVPQGVAFVDCPAVSIAAGETAALDVAACVASLSQEDADRLTGHGRVGGTSPLAVTVDIAGNGLLMSYAGAAEAVVDASEPGAALPNGSPVLVGALSRSEYQTWSSTVHVVNVEPRSLARVKAVFQDRSGDVIDTHIGWIGAGGNGEYRLPAIEELPGNWVGSVRVESLAYRDSEGGLVEPAALQGVLTSVRRSSLGQGSEPSEAFAYRLLPEHQAMEWPFGRGFGGQDGGAGVLAIPRLTKAGEADADPQVHATTELAIANLVQHPGFTDFVIYMFDQNGPVDYVCQRLNERQVEYVDLASWGFVADDFLGSALVSALYWDHPHVDGSGREVRNLLGLSGVMIQRTGTVLGQDLPGDEASASVLTLLSPDQVSDMALVPAQCPGTRPPTRTPEPTAQPTSTVSP